MRTESGEPLWYISTNIGGQFLRKCPDTLLVGTFARVALFDLPDAQVNACQFGFAFSVVHRFHLFAGLHHAHANVLLHVIGLARFHFQGTRL